MEINNREYSQHSVNMFDVAEYKHTTRKMTEKDQLERALPKVRKSFFIRKSYNGNVIPFL